MEMIQDYKIIPDVKKTRHIAKMQNSSDAMEKENFEIELKINELKERMKKEKEERERMGGTRWQSSRKSIAQKAVNANKKQSVKLLKDDTLDKYYSQRKASSENGTSVECGQCSKQQAKVYCNECLEVYCTTCYKQFHSRGALRKHSWQHVHELDSSSYSNEKKKLLYAKRGNLKKESRQLYRNHSSTKSRSSGEEEKSISDVLAQVANESRSNESTSGGINHPVEKTSLFQGSFDEEKNAQEFAEALAAWRMSRKSSTTSKSTETSTEKSIIEKPSVQINLNLSTSPSSLTYLDRIFVKQHKKKRRDAATSRNNSLPKITVSNGEHFDINMSTTPKEALEPCVLSLYFTDDTAEKSDENPASIEILPCDDESEDSEVDGSIPIVLTDDSTDDGELRVRAASRRSTARIVEVDFTRPNDSSNNHTNVIEPPRTPNVSRAPQNLIENKMFSPLLESPDHVSLSPTPKYEGMGKFFLIGATPCGDEARETYELTANSDAGDFVALRTKENWIPQESTPKESENDVGSLQRKISGVQKLAVFRDVSRKPSCDVAKFNAESYDYMQALPPLIKGDNYDKVHRASTSLSIGITPFDIWQESDSFPSSRRPSHLNNQFTRRSMGSKCGGDRQISFDNIDRLAEQIAESNFVEEG